MAPRTVLVALAAAALLAVSAPAAAHDPAPDAVVPRTEPAPIDVTARLQVTGDGLLVSIGGTRLEVRVADDGPEGAAPFARVPGAREFRARLDLDGRVTNLLFRFFSPPGGPGAAQ